VIEYKRENDTRNPFDILEHAFEHGGMSLVAPLLPAETAMEQARADLERVEALRSRIGQMQRTRVDTEGYDLLPELAPLLPGGVLHTGVAYSVTGSTSLLMALIAAPSRDGAWCGVVGMPGFGVEAANGYGVDLERLVLVPHPGDQWLSVTAALADAVSLVIVRPPASVGAADAARLGARLRQRGTTLLVSGQWPRSEGTMRITGSSWSGVGRGHGYPVERLLSVSVTDRSNAGRPRTVHLALPISTGAVGGPPSGRSTSNGSLLRAVG
jgi:hypothetical protein